MNLTAAPLYSISFRVRAHRLTSGTSDLTLLLHKHPSQAVTTGGGGSGHWEDLARSKRHRCFSEELRNPYTEWICHKTI